MFVKNLAIRPCQIGILLSVNSSLTSLGTYSHKKHKPEMKTQLFYNKNNALYKLILLIEKKHHLNMKQWFHLLMK